MILYLDASALVKRYVAERGSDEVQRSVAEAEAVGTVIVSRAEVTAALAKAARLGVLTRAGARAADRRLRRDWPDFVRLPVSEPLLERASQFAWDFGLRGYDSVQLAAGVLWQEVLQAEVAFATFDRQLWTTAGRAGLEARPHDLPALLGA
jgi:predicted nucleic acid-binding protein